MLRPAATFGLCLALAGCGLLGPRTVGPDGLSVYDGDIRRLARQGRFEDALAFAESDGGSAGDELLSTLNIAAIEHYGGNFESSTQLLTTADIEIDTRFTKSVSKAALSLVTNDRSLEWLPTRIERPMIHVYGALSYLGMDDTDEAAVEARRLSMLLDGMAPEEMPPDEADYYRTLRYFAGAVFEVAGEVNDAAVAYGHAGFEPRESIDSHDEFGEVVLVVESGFIANRIERSVNLLLDDDERDYLRHGSERDRYHAATCMSADRLSFAFDSFGGPPDRDGCRRRRPGRDRRNRKKDDDDDGVAYLLRVAWPVMQRSVDDASNSDVYAYAPDLDISGETLVRADLSGAAIAEFNTRAPEILIKALARAAVKYAVVEAIADDSEAVQIVGNAITALLERADTRGWTLLPSTLEIVKLRLPPGVHRIEVEAYGRGFPSGPHAVDDVVVEAGRLTVVSARAWP